jgi:C4-dicarboxylate-specific signal transduction histidine kinase
MILEIKDDIVTIHLKDVISRLLVVFIIVIILSLPFIYILSNIFEKIRLKLENQIKLEIDKNTQKDKLLLHNSRLAIMGEMLAMIAHQWKQPLASQKAILNAIEIRRRLNTLDEEYLVKSLSKFNNLSTFLSNTIDDFRNFFKKDKDKSLVNIKKIIENSIDLVSDLYIKNNIKIDIKEEKQISLNIYYREFQQVIINIINNAKDALIENSIKEPKIDINIYQKNKKVFIDICDNAKGVPLDIIDKIFDPYFSTKSKNGTGLGLYMSKIIIDEHLNGLLSVRNSQKGAIFTIELKNI